MANLTGGKPVRDFVIAAEWGYIPPVSRGIYQRSYRLAWVHILHTTGNRCKDIYVVYDGSETFVFLLQSLGQCLPTGNVSTLLNLHQAWRDMLPEGQNSNDWPTDEGEASPQGDDEMKRTWVMMLCCSYTRGDQCWKYLDPEDYWNTKILHCVENVAIIYYFLFKMSAIHYFVFL